MERCDFLQFPQTLWLIEADSIKEWRLKASAFDRKFIPQMDSFLIPSFSVDIKNGSKVEISPEAAKCDFLRFLENTSTGIPGGLANKLTCIGFLLSRNESNTKIILAYNYANSEGRNGKSIVMDAIERVKPTLIYDGNYKGLRKRNYKPAIPKIIRGVREQHPCVFCVWDTPRTLNMNIIKFLSHYFGDVPTLVTSRCVKVKTNDPDVAHMPFSGFYNTEHRPSNDFSARFFTEWNSEQWNLFYNLMGHCIKLYLKHGIIKTKIYFSEKEASHV